MTNHLESPQHHTPPDICAVIPAHNAAATLAECIEALRQGTLPPSRIIVFDDGSTDGTTHIAQRAGAVVITNPGAPVGPAMGRNTAARSAQNPIIVFVDSDVLVHRDGVERLVAALLEEPNVAATFGSYDNAPRALRYAGRYVNLRHHVIHQAADRKAETFWSGFGAVKRSAFDQIGGFETQYTVPSLEDVELGVRLRKAGWRITLVKDALAKHCKDWRLLQLWRTDIMYRAIPWTLIMLESGSRDKVLNASPRERAKAAIALLSLASLLASAVSPLLLAPAAAGGLLYTYLNRDFYGVLRRSGGARLAVVGGLLHAAYHIYAPLTFMIVQLLWHLGIRPSHNLNNPRAEPAQNSIRPEN